MEGGQPNGLIFQRQGGDSYYDMGAGRGQEGLQLLQQAVQDGDADACCLLARCLYGPEYT